MSDIVERLKSGTCGQGCGTMTECICATAEDAADEITRLRLELRDAYTEVDFQTDKVASHGEAITRLRAEVERLKAEIKRAIRQHEEGNKGLAHRTLCEAIYGEQA